MDDRLEELLADPRIDDRERESARALIARAMELGGTDEEILAAVRLAELGPLLMDLAIRPPGATVTLDAFVEHSGLDPDFARRTWSALGLPTQGLTAAVVTPDAAAAVHVIAFMAEGLGADAAIGVARVIGATAASLAEALSNATRIGAELPQRDTGVPYEDVIGEMSEAARELLPAFWDAVGGVFRRHMVRVSYQRWAADDERAAVTHTSTVGFVDLVGSTEVLRTQSVAELAAAVDRFEQLVWEQVTRHGGRVIKLIGDEAMFVVDDPVAACKAALALIESSPQAVRVGLAHGEIAALHGDRYGPTVNLAARLVAVAEPGTVVVSASMRDAHGDAIDVMPIDPGPLRGFPDVTTAFVLAPVRDARPAP